MQETETVQEWKGSGVLTTAWGIYEGLKEGDAHAMRSSTTASKDVVKNRNANGREK